VTDDVENGEGAKNRNGISPATPPQPTKDRFRTTVLVNTLAKKWRNHSPVALFKRLEASYTNQELDEARERLITPTSGKQAKVEAAAPIRFTIGHTRSKVSTPEILKKKRDDTDAALALAAVRERSNTLNGGLIRERALEVGIDPDVDHLRLHCLRLIDHRYFQFVVLMLICASSFLLAPQADVDWPVPGSSTEWWVDAADICFTAAFTVEMLLRMIALTVQTGPQAYLKDSWNCLDGFIVVMSLLTYGLSNFGGGIGRVLKAFRVLRVLRPLRMIKTVPSLKLVIDATLVSLPSIMTVCALGFIIMIILGVLGITLFKGLFWSCSLEEPPATKTECEAAGGEWQNAPFNFDNIGHASVAVFIISTGDNWQDLMWSGMDVSAMDKQPVKKNSPLSAIYFVFVVVVAFFFWANLFVSALVDNFSRVASELQGIPGLEGYRYSESQRKWLQALSVGLEEAKEAWRDVNMENLDLVRWTCLKLRKWKNWDNFVIFFITCNAVQLCLIRYGAPPEEVRVMDILGIVFTVMYVVETAINIIAMEWSAYWDSSWHRVDFVVTVLGVLELAADLIGGEGGFVTVFRTARFFRLFKMLKSSRGVRSLLNTFLSALPGMVNIMMLMALLMHIYACLGCTLYGSLAGPYLGNGLTAYTNFKDWPSAMMLLFVVLSGNWVGAFQDVYWTCEVDPVTGAHGAEGCSYRWSAIFYFFSFVILGLCLLSNLFVAILLERFDYASTMEGVYDEQNPFDMMRRLTIIRRFAYKVRYRLKMVQTLRSVEELNTGRDSNIDAPGLRRSLNARISTISSHSLRISDSPAEVEDKRSGQNRATGSRNSRSPLSSEGQGGSHASLSAAASASLSSIPHGGAVDLPMLAEEGGPCSSGVKGGGARGTLRTQGGGVDVIGGRPGSSAPGLTISLEVEDREDGEDGEDGEDEEAVLVSTDTAASTDVDDGVAAEEGVHAALPRRRSEPREEGSALPAQTSESLLVPRALARAARRTTQSTSQSTATTTTCRQSPLVKHTVAVVNNPLRARVDADKLDHAAAAEVLDTEQWPTSPLFDAEQFPSSPTDLPHRLFDLPPMPQASAADAVRAGSESGEQLWHATTPHTVLPLSASVPTRFDETNLTPRTLEPSSTSTGQWGQAVSKARRLHKLAAIEHWLASGGAPPPTLSFRSC